MPLQNFVPRNTPTIGAAWLNQVDVLKFTVFDDAATKQAAITALFNNAANKAFGRTALEIDSGVTFNATDSSGVANTVTLTLTGPVGSPTIAVGTKLNFTAAQVNTSAVTMTVNGGAAAAVVNQLGNACTGGELFLPVTVVWTGANWRIVAGGIPPTLARTAGEIGALPTAVVPVNYLYPDGHILRYGNNTVPGTTDMSAALQAAIDSRTAASPEVFLTGSIGIGSTVLIRESGIQNLSIIGSGRVATILLPLAASIAVATRGTPPVAAENTNVILFNQKDNGHLHLQGFRVLDSVAYTGKFLYCVENGGGDNTGETLFSSVVHDCWFSFSTNNSGIFEGDFSNVLVYGNVFEATKDACFIAGNIGDGIFTDNVMNFCFDNFIRQTGAVINLLLVDGLHVYQHLRGRIIELNSATNVNINNVQVEWDAANVGDCGLIKLTTCEGIRVTQCSVTTDSGTPRGDIGIDIINAVSATFENLRITTDIGLRVQGTGAMDVTLMNCDFIGCQHAFQQLSGTLSGQLRFIDCRLNNSDEYGMLHQAGTPSFSIDFLYGEVLNAGMGGIATSRNINISTTGTVRFVGTKVGQNDAGAAAAYYWRTDGGAPGTVKAVFPVRTGAPPTGMVDPASTQAVEFVWEPSSLAKTFQLAAGTNNILVNDPDVLANSVIAIMPTNVAATVVQSSPQHLYCTARVVGTSFTFTTGDGTNAAAGSNFAYRILP